MKRLIIVTTLIALFASCNNSSTVQTKSQPSSDTAFQKLADGYLDGYLAARPLYAVALGFH
jgi:hypothetical protein